MSLLYLSCNLRQTTHPYLHTVGSGACPAPLRRRVAPRCSNAAPPPVKPPGGRLRPGDWGILEPGVPETVLLREGAAMPHRERGRVLVEGAHGVDVPPGPVPRRRRAAEDVPGRGEAAGDGLDNHLAGIQEGHDGVALFGPTGLVAKDGRMRRKRRVDDGNEGEERPAMEGRVVGDVRIMR